MKKYISFSNGSIDFSSLGNRLGFVGSVPSVTPDVSPFKLTSDTKASPASPFLNSNTPKRKESPNKYNNRTNKPVRRLFQQVANELSPSTVPVPLPQDHEDELNRLFSEQKITDLLKPLPINKEIDSGAVQEAVTLLIDNRDNKRYKCSVEGLTSEVINGLKKRIKQLNVHLSKEMDCIQRQAWTRISSQSKLKFEVVKKIPGRPTVQRWQDILKYELMILQSESKSTSSMSNHECKSASQNRNKDTHLEKVREVLVHTRHHKLKKEWLQELSGLDLMQLTRIGESLLFPDPYQGWTDDDKKRFFVNRLLAMVSNLNTGPNPIKRADEYRKKVNDDNEKENRPPLSYVNVNQFVQEININEADFNYRAQDKPTPSSSELSQALIEIRKINMIKRGTSGASTDSCIKMFITHAVNAQKEHLLRYGPFLSDHLNWEAEHGKWKKARSKDISIDNVLMSRTYPELMVGFFKGLYMYKVAIDQAKVQLCTENIIKKDRQERVFESLESIKFSENFSDNRIVVKNNIIRSVELMAIFMKAFRLVTADGIAISDIINVGLAITNGNGSTGQ